MTSLLRYLPLQLQHDNYCDQGCISCGILVSGIRARGVSSEHMENMEMFSCSPTLIYRISRDGSKNFNIRTCEHVILGQLRI